MKAFEKPLTALEEKEYFYNYRNGDKKAYESIIWRNMRLVAHIAKKYMVTELDMEDIISVGTIGLIKAVISFDEKKGSKFATYASRCIDNEILMMFRSNKKRSKEISLNDPIGTDKEGNEISLYEIIESKDVDILDTIELRDDIFWLKEAFFNLLNKREQQVIALRYGFCKGKEYTQLEIARMLKISRSYVSRIEKRALEKLRKGHSG